MIQLYKRKIVSQVPYITRLTLKQKEKGKAKAVSSLQSGQPSRRSTLSTDDKNELLNTIMDLIPEAKTDY